MLFQTRKTFMRKENKNDDVIQQFISSQSPYSPILESITYNILQKWVHPSHFSNNFSTISQGTILLKWNLDIYYSQRAACIEVQIYCPLNITQHINIIVQITGNKNVKTVSKVSIFSKGTIVI